MAANGEILASDPENLVPRPQSHGNKQRIHSVATQLHSATLGIEGDRSKKRVYII
jgi:hypothetical protein